jgi:electron transfer flavoprotein beta subunit
MAFQIIVCIKSVVTVAPQGATRRTPENSQLNPFDRPALEAALQIKAKTQGQVTAISMGPNVSGEALTESLAMGVDRTVLVSDPALKESDTLVTARVLAAAIMRLGSFDLLLFGTRTTDSDTGQVGPQTAAVLDIPFVSRVTQIITEGENWTLERRVDQWSETWQVALPMAMTIDARAFDPRPVSLTGVSQAFEQPHIETFTLRELSLSEEAVGLSGSPTRVARLEKIKQDRRCSMLPGDPQKQVAALMEHLTKAGIV